MTYSLKRMIDPHTQENAPLNVLSLILIGVAWTCKFFSMHFSLIFSDMVTINFVDVYDLLFKTLSLISVIMVLIINWPKFKERAKKIIAKWKKKHK